MTPASPDPGVVLVAQRRAVQMAEERGWSRHVLGRVTDALLRVLADHEGGPVRASHAHQQLARAHPQVRVFEVLDDLGLLEDDRIGSTRVWIERRCADLPDGFRTDVRDWLLWLLDGDARTRPRTVTTLHVHFGQARPVLERWGAEHDHLREITRAEVIQALDLLQGHERFNTATALKSLFRFTTKYRRVFANPTTGLSVSRGDLDDLLPLTNQEIATIEDTAASPAQRLAVALAAVHAARGETIRLLTLDDVDLSGDRITLAGQRRPLGELTRATLLGYLRERRERWPHTGNRHVLISTQTANGTAPISTYYLKKHLTLRGVSLERIRIDRFLHETLATGADPLHLAMLFNVHPTTAVRYAACARRILDEALTTAIQPPGRSAPLGHATDLGV